MKRIASSLLMIILLNSCNYFVVQEKVERSSEIVAIVNTEKLFKEDLKDVLPQNTSREDSIVIVKSFINDWAIKQLLLNKAENNNLDHKRNIMAGRIPIQSKTWAEKFRIMNPEMFSGDTSKSMQERGYSDEQVVGMESKQAQLAQEGYGFKKVYPVDKLKLLTLKKLAKEKKTLKKQKLKQLLKTSNMNNLQKMLPNLSKLF